MLAQARDAARAVRNPLGCRCTERHAAQMRALLALWAQGLHPHASEHRKRRARNLRAVSSAVKTRASSAGKRDTILNGGAGSLLAEQSRLFAEAVLDRDRERDKKSVG